MKNRRSKSQIPQLSPSELRNILESKAERLRDSCLIALLYLSGRRIGEVLPLQKRDFNFNETRFLSFRTFNEKTYRSYPSSDYKLESMMESIHGPQVVYYEEINPKFSLHSPSGRELSPFILKHLESLSDQDYLFAPLRRNRKFINASRAYQIITAMEPRLWLHALRHLRFTAYGRAYRDNPMAMHDITFHKRFESTMEYIRPAEVEERLQRV